MRTPFWSSTRARAPRGGAGGNTITMHTMVKRRMLGAIRALYTTHAVFLSRQRLPCHAMPAHDSGQPISSFAFAMHSMAHRGERILAAGGHKDGRILVRIRILRPGAPQTHGHPWSRGSDLGAGWPLSRRVACARSPVANLQRLRDYLGNSERTHSGHPTVMIPVPCSIGVAASFRAES